MILSRQSALAILVLLFPCHVSVLNAEVFSFDSPDGRVVVSFEVDATGRPVYSVMRDEKPIVVESRLGFSLKGAPALASGFAVETVTPIATQRRTWKPVYGERSEVRDHYREMVVYLKDNQTPARRIEVKFRAYNEGIALCYTFPEQEGLKDLTIDSELTEFRFAANHEAWPVYSAQGEYRRTRLDQVRGNCERPLTIHVDDTAATKGPWVAVGEARLVDFARMRLKPTEGMPYGVQAMLASDVNVTTPYTTPWRFVMIADRPGRLIEQNDLLLNLSDPCAIADVSWIKPGKVIREVTLTTEGGKACVDFAVKRGIQYVEYDAGWYGPEGNAESDATTVTRDTNKSGVKGPLDLKEVIRYADERGIGILVYVNRRALETQLDEILPLYKEWGIKGLKYGFVQVGSQHWTNWLHDAVRKAAKYEMMVDIHDEYRPTGYSRTYPNLMTQEGIRGNECMPTAEHNLILPFTRGLCGAGDYTPCWYSGSIKTSRAHQLALPVVFYSPLQFIHWYDRPSQYQGEPELKFFKDVPAAWDDTRVIQGEIGQYITMARRSGRQWYVGSLNAVARRELEVPLEFLEPNKKYTAEIYSDAKPDGSDSKKVTVTKREVDATTVLRADLAPNGGQAIRLVPRD